jgi:hypothetical protein
VGVDPLEPVVDPHARHGQQREAVEGEQPLDMGGAGEEAVGDEEQPVPRGDRVGGIGGGAGDDHLETLAAQAVDRGEKIGRHALHRDDDRIGARAGGEADLALDEGAPAERKRRAQAPARLVGFVIGGDERGETQVVPPFPTD